MVMCRGIDARSGTRMNLIGKTSGPISNFSLEVPLRCNTNLDTTYDSKEWMMNQEGSDLRMQSPLNLWILLCWHWGSLNQDHRSCLSPSISAYDTRISPLYPPCLRLYGHSLNYGLVCCCWRKECPSRHLLCVDKFFGICRIRLGIKDNQCSQPRKSVLLAKAIGQAEEMFILWVQRRPGRMNASTWNIWQEPHHVPVILTQVSPMFELSYCPVRTLLSGLPWRWAGMSQVWQNSCRSNARSFILLRSRLLANKRKSARTFKYLVASTHNL